MSSAFSIQQGFFLPLLLSLIFLKTEFLYALSVCLALSGLCCKRSNEHHSCQQSALPVASFSSASPWDVYNTTRLLPFSVPVWELLAGPLILFVGTPACQALCMCSPVGPSGLSEERIRFPRPLTMRVLVYRFLPSLDKSAKSNCKSCEHRVYFTEGKGGLNRTEWDRTPHRVPKGAKTLGLCLSLSVSVLRQKGLSQHGCLCESLCLSVSLSL